jgi:hypothetical protein
MKMLRKIRKSIIRVLNEMVKILTQEYHILVNYC